jgi:hypothetical protein
MTDQAFDGLAQQPLGWSFATSGHLVPPLAAMMLLCFAGWLVAGTERTSFSPGRERHGLHPQLVSGWTTSREHRLGSSFSRIATPLLNRKTSPQ